MIIFETPGFILRKCLYLRITPFELLILGDVAKTHIVHIIRDEYRVRKTIRIQLKKDGKIKKLKLRKIRRKMSNSLGLSLSRFETLLYGNGKS